ncbi:MAG TPA: NEAT domain-containing protein [Candidatus Avamphibacillus sp.]|nr:NEAT domain-containing protein [Candidatus Avamphibacillus sp.]
MNKKFSSLLLIVTALVLTITLGLPQETVFADIADGTYEINYEMKEAGSENTSIADGYFSKPATLTVENGTKYVQLTVTSASMIKSLSAPSGPVDVVSDNGDTRTVKFRVDGDLSQPVNMEMHIVVPDLYDTTHTARAVFDTSGLDGSSATNKDSDDGATTAEGNDSEKTEENPPTGDNSQLALYAVLLLASVGGIFVIWKTRAARN